MQTTYTITLEYLDEDLKKWFEEIFDKELKTYQEALKKLNSSLTIKKDVH